MSFIKSKGTPVICPNCGDEEKLSQFEMTSRTYWCPVCDKMQVVEDGVKKANSWLFEEELNKGESNEK